MEWSSLSILGVIAAGAVGWSLRQRSTRPSDPLRDPYYRMRSQADIETAVAQGVYIDANQATVDDWLRLPGLSIHQARTLTALTQSGVQFHCLDDVAAALSLPVQRLQPLVQVVKFSYYDPDGIEAVKTVNVNTASIELLTTVPGIDLYLARAIAHNRNQSGAYKNLPDFQQRLFLPGSLVSDLMHYLRF